MTSRPAFAAALIVVLAGLDLVGAMFARRYLEQRSLFALVAGCSAFVALFVVYALSLRYAEMSTVTFGWIVLLQVGVLLMERFQRNISLSPDRAVVVIALLALQAYLMLTPAN
jgi:hypothetical protein